MQQFTTTAYEVAMRFAGEREVAGKTANPQILSMLQLDNGWVEDDSTPWCFTGDVEVLTKTGFVRIDSITKETELASVSTDDLKVSFDKPIRLIRARHRNLAQFRSRNFQLTCSANHRFLGVWNKTPLGRKAELRPISDLGYMLSIPSFQKTGIDNPVWSERDLTLLAAFLSDGSLHHNRVSIQVSKPRKIQALSAISGGRRYDAKRVYGPLTKTALTTFEFEWPLAFGDAFNDYKKPCWDLLHSLSVKQIRRFLAEYTKYDGHIKSGGSVRLYTSDLYLRDWLQTACLLAGFHASTRVSAMSPFTGRPCHEIVFSPSKKFRTVRRADVEFVGSAKPIEMFCAETRYGTLVIRDPQTGVATVTGNCSAFVSYIAFLLGLPRSKSLAARSWLAIGTPVELANARSGFDVVILKRGKTPQPGPEVLHAPGHVGFFSALSPAFPGSSRSGKVYLLGGNQGDAVSVAPFDTEDVLGVRRLWG